MATYTITLNERTTSGKERIETMRRIVLMILASFCICTGRAQKMSEPEHLFTVFFYDSDSVRTDIPENENVSTKLTGFMAHKAKIVLYGESAKTKLYNIEDLYIEIKDTTQLKPQFFRVLKLHQKKGNREATCWSHSPIGVKDSSADFIPTMLYPIGNDTYRISIKELQPGAHLIMYQEGLQSLMELYDFDVSTKM